MIKGKSPVEETTLSNEPPGSKEENISEGKPCKGPTAGAGWGGGVLGSRMGVEAQPGPES